MRNAYKGTGDIGRMERTIVTVDQDSVPIHPQVLESNP